MEKEALEAKIHPYPFDERTGCSQSRRCDVNSSVVPEDDLYRKESEADSARVESVRNRGEIE
jgi:hypothetical protein